MCFSPEDSRSSLRPTLPSRLSLLVSLEKAFFFFTWDPWCLWVLRVTGGIKGADSLLLQKHRKEPNLSG